ncbi:MAG: TonB-dependent receptor [Woeseiaceae bacterium]|nr:TonB-dependent receptor [Woeseiaceae bacterium]
MRTLNHIYRASLMSAIVISLWAPSPAFAQAAIEEIIVTAQKREESLQEVPIAMQAFTGEQIRDLRIGKISDVTKLVPNMNISMQNPANRSINIRGIGTSDFFGAAPGSVGIYLDEVTLSSPYLTAVGIYDMERIEVLRGPQNSLFGRNTTGGAVNYISRKPTPGGEPDGYASVSVGNYNLIELEAAASFNLSESAAVRFAGKSFDRDGIWNNMDAGGADYGDQDRKSLRGTLVWEPAESTVVTSNFHWAEEDSEITPYRHVGTRLGTGAFLGPSAFGPTDQLDYDGVDYATVNHQGVDPSFPAWENVNRTGSGKHEMDTWGAYVRIDHDFGWATGTSITAYDESDTLFSIDAGGSGNIGITPASVFAGENSSEPNLLIDQDQFFEQFSQEFRLASPSDQKFRWIAGLYYFTEDSELSQNIRLGAATLISHPGLMAPIPNPRPGAMVATVDPGPPVVFGGSFGLWVFSQGLGLAPGAGYDDLASISIANMENDVWSPYLHTEYDVSDKLTLTVGVRYTNDDKQLPSYFVGNLDTSGVAPSDFLSNEEVRSMAAAQVASGLASPTCSGDGTYCAEDTTRSDLDAGEWGGKIGLDYQINDNNMIYGSISRGFRSGKYDIEFLHGAHTAFPLQDAVPETLNAFEVGYKSELAGGSVQLNIAAFFYRWFDKQTFFVDPATGPEFSNVPESESKGAEVEFKWVPAEDWFISLDFGFLDTEITEASPLASDELGHELQYAADFSFNGRVIKDIQIANGTLSLQVDYQYVGNSKTNLATVALIDELGSHSVLGARASYVFGSDQQFEISAFGENLTADRWCEYQFNLDALNGVAYCVPNEGQEFWGVQGLIKF